jgi:hypothetical protein
VDGGRFERARRFSDEELLSRLKDLAGRHGRLSGLLIDETDGMPSSSVYRHRFGSLVRAYQIIEYTLERDLEFIEVNRRLRQLHPKIVDGIIKLLSDHAGARRRDLNAPADSRWGRLTRAIGYSGRHRSAFRRRRFDEIDRAAVGT